ncbi:MAG: UDP-N-acetylmuramoyl-L-alanine--D-glutamate ligase [Hydrotalea sp.]|nr:UDP-N-acetylmuramoyl-L-alanine--D-glutamate ligase [Hydrotalea sp.]
MLLPSYQKNKKKIYVVGLGVTGLAAVKTLVASGADVVAFDDDEKNRATAESNGITILSPADWGKGDNIDMLLLSPGIVANDSKLKKSHPAAVRARQLGVAIRVDVDLLFDELGGDGDDDEQDDNKRDFVFITGTNGKSTTTKLTAHLLTANRRSATMGGNIGLAALSLPVLPNNAAGRGVYVLELSSYQIERMADPVPQVAVLLNLSFDHLERHDTMEHYLAIKTKIFGTAQAKQPKLSVIGIDDEFCRGFYEKNKNNLRLIPISGLTLPSGGVGVVDNNLVDNRDGTKKTIAGLPLHPALPGPHNAQNLAAAYLVADYYGMAVKDFVAGVATFVPLAHRQELVAQFGDVAYINDSKATNVDAALMSLRSFKNIRWLAGGELKSGDRFHDLLLAADNIARGYFFGAGAKQLQQAVMAKIDGAVFDNLADALAAAHQDAKQGEVVLLSPVGASFDQYKNFEERGNDFKTRVLALKNLP